LLAQFVHFGFRVGELSTPTRYFAEASSINFSRSVRYGLGVLATSLQFRLHKMKLIRSRIFRLRGQKLLSNYYKQIEAESVTNKQ
jgi:hypothetical protein